MTQKKYRDREFRRLRKLGWPYHIASRGAKHGLANALHHYGWEYIDDLTLGRTTYYKEETDEVLYRYDDDTFKVFCINGKPLYLYYD